jgi:hypothetical protein
MPMLLPMQWLSARHRPIRVPNHLGHLPMLIYPGLREDLHCHRDGVARKHRHGSGIDLVRTHDSYGPGDIDSRFSAVDKYY